MKRWFVRMLVLALVAGPIACGGDTKKDGPKKGDKKVDEGKDKSDDNKKARPGRDMGREDG